MDRPSSAALEATRAHSASLNRIPRTGLRLPAGLPTRPPNSAPKGLPTGYQPAYGGELHRHGRREIARYRRVRMSQICRKKSSHGFFDPCRAR